MIFKILVNRPPHVLKLKILTSEDFAVCNQLWASLAPARLARWWRRSPRKSQIKIAFRNCFSLLFQINVQEQKVILSFSRPKRHKSAESSRAFRCVKRAKTIRLGGKNLRDQLKEISRTRFMYSTTQTTWKRRKWGKNFEHLSGRGGRDTRSTFKIRPAWYWTRALAANFPYQELFFALLWRASLVLCAFSVAARPFCAVLQLLIIFLQPVEEREKNLFRIQFSSLDELNKLKLPSQPTHQFLLGLFDLPIIFRENKF